MIRDALRRPDFCLSRREKLEYIKFELLLLNRIDSIEVGCYLPSRDAISAVVDVER
jgi:hypothetical protein